MELNRLTEQVIGAAMKVHSALGPGLLESACQVCLFFELKKQGLSVEREVVLPLEYDEVTIDAGYRMDLLVENSVVLELKSVDRILPIHEAQLITYLKLSRKKVGLLINFNVLHLKDGVTRRAN